MNICTFIKNALLMGGISKFEERELLLQVAEGTEKAFRKIFDQYYDQIYGVVYGFTKSPALAADITQEIFIKLWLKRSSLPGIQRFNDFLFMVARNQTLNALRNKVRDERYSDYLRRFSRVTEESPEQQMFFRESEELINMAVEKLPLRQQMIYRMSREEELSQDDIAKKLQISKNTVKSHMNKALQFIRHFYLLHSDIVLLILCLRLL